jgi:hypothetical protein
MMPSIPREQKHANKMGGGSHHPSLSSEFLISKFHDRARFAH